MPWNKDGSRKSSAMYKKSGFKMKGWSAGHGTGSHLKKETNYLDDKENPKSNTLGPPKGRIGSEYRKKEYDARGWAYDDTINTDAPKGGNEVEEAKKRAPHRYAGLSDDRIREILAKERKRSMRGKKKK